MVLHKPVTRFLIKSKWNFSIDFPKGLVILWVFFAWTIFVENLKIFTKTTTNYIIIIVTDKNRCQKQDQNRFYTLAEYDSLSFHLIHSLKIWCFYHFWFTHNLRFLGHGAWMRQKFVCYSTVQHKWNTLQTLSFWRYKKVFFSLRHRRLV